MTVSTDANIKRNRDLSLDAIAGLFIILMMFQHFNINTRAPYTIGHIFMFNTSWFFFKSGIFHRPQKFSWSLIWKWIRRFIVPFLIFSFIGVTAQLIVEHRTEVNPISAYYGMFGQIARYGSPWWNIPLWFLLTMFLVKVTTMSYGGGKLSTCLYFIFAIGIAILHHHYITDFNYIGNTALAIIFYIFGYKSTSWPISFVGHITILIIFCASILIIPTAIDIWSNTALYGNYFLAIIGAVCGMILVNKLFAISKFLQIRPFVFMGQNAMTFLICHVPIALAVRSLCTRHHFADPILIPWIEAAVAIPICLLICIFFDKNPRLKWIIGG